MLLESIGDGVFALDTQGRIISWNPAMAQITGYMAKEATRRLDALYRFDRIVGKSHAMQNIFSSIKAAAASELFGHMKGAFTGAIRDRTGRFEEADEGTVFLDEIGEISSFIQIKLLRVLQQKEIERVGESRKRKINIRIIAATNKDLYNLVQEGRFRGNEAGRVSSCFF